MDSKFATTNPAIAVHDLTKVFPGSFKRKPVIAVRDLNLQIGPGQIYGLLGPNGSGKSTTLKIILGLISPTRGRAEIFGCNSTRVESRRSVDFLPENPYFYKFLTGTETLQFYGRIAGLSRARLQQRILELLELVGLTAAANRRLSTYSKGMLQRIGLAQAVIHEPKVVILDEPTAGVDPVGSREMCDLILGLKKQNVTVLLSSHLLGQVQEICDRVGILNNGSLVCEGPLDELLGIGNQTEVILENVPDEVVERIKAVVKASPGRLIAARGAQTTLESLFLQATANRPAGGLGKSDPPQKKDSLMSPDLSQL